MVSNSTTSDERSPIRSSVATSGFSTTRRNRRSISNLRRAFSALLVDTATYLVGLEEDDVS